MTGTRLRLAALGLAAIALVGGACSSSNETSTGGPGGSGTVAPSDTVTVTDVWARSLPTGRGAVYMKLTASEDDALLDASVPSDIAGKVEIHETVMASEGTAMSGMDDEKMSEGTAMSGMDDEKMSEGSMTDDTMGSMGDGTMTMQPVDEIELPAGETVVLEPGGYHVMLLDMPETLAAGTTFEVTLTFEKAGTRTVTAEVRDA